MGCNPAKDTGFWYSCFMPRLWAKTVTFESVQVGDRLPILIKWETRESIERSNARLADDEEETADPALSLQPAVLQAYVKELLGKGFPPESITAPGSRLELGPTIPVIAGDTISLSGRVVEKREDGGRRLVGCAIVIENQDGKAVGQATAVVVL